MQKNSTRALIAVVIIIIIAIGAYAIFHKSSNNNTATNNNPAGQNSSPAVNNAVVTTKTDPNLGKYLADPNGRALYIYNADSPGTSNCTGSCLATWPAYQASASATNLPAGISTIKRSDNGQTQYTYNGMPLYYFASDSGNQVTGNDVENFQVAKPAASQENTSPQSQPTDSGSSSSGYPY